MQNFACVRKEWDQREIPIFTADSLGERWDRAQAVNRAVAQASMADVILVSDSDILLEEPFAQTKRACEVALERNAYVVAFTSLLYLDTEGTVVVREGWAVPGQSIFWDQTNIWGGVFAIPKSLWDEIGGFDERFQGYGAEDQGFLVCASTLGGEKARIPGRAFHLDHPEQAKGDFSANKALAKRYLDADGDREAVLEIMAER